MGQSRRHPEVEKRAADADALKESGADAPVLLEDLIALGTGWNGDVHFGSIEVTGSDHPPNPHVLDGAAKP